MPDPILLCCETAYHFLQLGKSKEKKEVGSFVLIPKRPIGEQEAYGGLGRINFTFLLPNLPVYSHHRSLDTAQAFLAQLC